MTRKIIYRVLSGLVLLMVGGYFLLTSLVSVNVPVLNALFGWFGDLPQASLLERRLKVPEGYYFNVYARVKGARGMKWTQDGDLLVSVPRKGQIVLLRRDANKDGFADGQKILLQNLNRPHGMEIIDENLFIGETDALARITFDSSAGTTQETPQRLITGLPGGGNHWARALKQGPDGYLYMNIGSSCNVCLEEDPRRATMMRFRPDGSEAQVFATGLRNTTGFTWNPKTGDMVGVDHGRDLLGDELPPEELNVIKEGNFYGWPFYYGANVPDPDFGSHEARPTQEPQAPLYEFSAHIAPLGILFVEGGGASAPGLEGALLVAQHGSWNSSYKKGYQVVSLHFEKDGSITQRPFFDGFLKDEDVIGRPVEISRGPEGAFYVTDDYSGTIYRISTTKPEHIFNPSGEDTSP